MLTMSINMNPDHFEEEKTPVVSKALIEYLQKIIPPRDHKPTDSVEEIMFYSGKREIVNTLKQLHLNQKR